MFDALPDAYVVLDRSFVIVAANDAYVRASMTRREDLVGRDLFDLFPDNPDDPTATGVSNLRASLNRVLESGAADTMAVQRYDVRRPAAAGDGFEERHWSPVNLPVLSGSEIVYIIHRVEDVTEFVRLKQAGSEQFRMTEALRARAAKMEREIFRRAQEIQETNKRLRQSEAQAQQDRATAEEANRAKDEFLATASHELRTPLTAILGWSRMLRSIKLDPSALARGIEVIERNAFAQIQLVNDLLDVSRIITGKLRLDPRTLDLTAVVHAAIDVVKPAAEAKNITIHTDLDPTAARIVGDPDRLQQVAWNLFANAIKFTPAHGALYVSLERVTSSVRVTVRDTGEGIRPEFLPHVFERFRQAEGTSIRRHGGLGLGLALVRHLVEQHGGTVTAESPGEGQGATFTVKLPVQAVAATPPTAEPARAERASPTPPAGAASIERCLVLVVDDEADARELIAFVLLAHGAEVIAVASTDEALEALKSRRYDMLISDISMPMSDGYDLIRRVRALAPEQGGLIPAAALTAYAREEDRRRALEAGFHMHVAKPIDPAELVAMVTHLAGRRS